MSNAPRIVLSVQRAIDEIIGSLVEQGWLDDQRRSFLRRLGSNQWEISFQGAEYIANILNLTDYARIYKELNDTRSFNGKLLDGGLLQFQYLFQQDCLIKHRLAYFPSPNLKQFQTDPESYIRDEMYHEIVSRHIITFPIRFDYDPTAAQTLVHPACHLTLGDFRYCRIPVSAPLAPHWFADFILRNFYRTSQYDPVASLPSNDIAFFDTIEADERRLIHIVIPSI